MATNTCISKITYLSLDNALAEPFLSDRIAKAETMFNEGKTESFPNAQARPTVEEPVGCRLWVDHAAAQEFIDYVIANAPSYNITLAATAIQDL